jgi:hypothetical protein
VNCHDVTRCLPGYLDGATKSGDHVRIREHLAGCAACCGELELYHQMARAVSRVEPVAPQAALAARITARACLEAARPSLLHRMWRRAELIFETVLEPLAVPATGGLLSAVLTFTLVTGNLFLGIPLGAVPNDLPLNLIQPARLEMLAPFPVPGLDSFTEHAASGVLVVEATVDAQGAVVGYSILSGVDNAATRRSLDQVLLFSRFRPQMSFGRPINGGRVVLSFNSVLVRG